MATTSKKVQELVPPSRGLPVAQGDLFESVADARARTAVEAAPALIWMAGADRRFEWFNTSWESFTGSSMSELCGDGWMALIHPEDVERCKGILVASFQARQPYSLDYRLRRHDGQYRWMLESAAPRFDAQGTFVGYVGSSIDIHERRQLEERLAERMQALRQAERRQGAFLAMLSHELRNPLAPIANAASVLRTLEESNPLLSRLRQILERQVTRLGRLVEDLIDATRAAQGHISLVSEHVGVGALVQGASAACKDQLDAIGHRLDVRLPQKELFVRGDPARLTQALANIISNAAKFTHEPSVISVEIVESRGNVEITVRDPGQGIAPEFLPYVFELFAQQEQAPGHKPSGLGVGLTLARRIAQLHAGNVEAFSEGHGKGARFVLTLPLVAAESAAAGTAEVPPLSESYRVLIIEDEDDTREALRLQMEMWGNEVRIVASGEEGLRAAASFKPHIVLCDIGLPGMNGFELLKPLREALRGEHSIFAAVTAQGRHEDEARALAVGYDSFLLKPLQPGSLVRLLRSYANGPH